MPDAQPAVRTRLGALDAQGWVFVLAGVASLLLAIHGVSQVVQGQGSPATVILFAAFAAFCGIVARQVAAPEVDGECAECGREVVVDSASDSTDVAVTVQSSRAPTRRSIGPVSFIGERERGRDVYCSATCARADLGPLRDYAKTSLETVESTAKDAVAVQIDQ